VPSAASPGRGSPPGGSKHRGQLGVPGKVAGRSTAGAEIYSVIASGRVQGGYSLAVLLLPTLSEEPNIKTRSSVFAALLLLVGVMVDHVMDNCGTCVDWQEEYCEAMQLAHPCHAFGYDDTGVSPRGMDMHMWAGQSIGLGFGYCGESHAAPCDPFEEFAADGAAAAVASLDASTLFQIVGDLRLSVWYNGVDGDVMISAVCTATSPRRILTRIAVDSQEAADYWRRTLTSSEVVVAGVASGVW
jgi:hypothetical protein